MKINWSTLLLLLSSFFFVAPAYGLEVSRPVYVSAAIGDNRVTINGYTSPNLRVELSSAKVFAITFADSTGYFVFDKTLLPKNPSDLCLTATDDNGRLTTPICVPSPPATNYQTDIGPIILPPTLTLDSDTIKPGQTTIASGQSLPNSSIDIYFYQVDSHPSIFPKSVQAFGLPIYTVNSDSSGNYSFTLPTAYSTNYRLYSTVKYQDNSSPKSNTLTYKLPSLFYLFWLQNSTLIILLPLFIITFTIFVYLLCIPYLQKPIKRYLPALFIYPLVIVKK